MNRSGKPETPSISITPLPRGSSTSPGARAGVPATSVLKPGQVQNSQQKATFVICEICDGYIKVSSNKSTSEQSETLNIFY